MNKISIYGSFEDLPLRYKKIFIEASPASGLFLSIPWFHNLVATSFDKNTLLRIYGVEDVSGYNEPCLVLAMCYQCSSGGWFTPRRLVPVANYYTSLFGPIFGESTPYIKENLNLLAKTIVGDRPHWDLIDLHPMDVANPSFDNTRRAFRLAGLAVQTYFCFGNWYLEVNGRSYQEYFKSLPAKLRNTLNRKTKKLKDTDRIRLEIFSNFSNLDNGIATFEKIYNSSWKVPEPYPEFIPGLIRTCAEQGWLRMGIAYIDNQPAAAQIWMVSHNVASIYKLAYDEKFSKLSVGTILTARLMQHVIDIDHVCEVDYLTGDDDYKRDWMSHRRERWGIIAFNLRTLNGVLAAIKHMGGRSLKNIFSSIARKTFPHR